MPMQPTYTTKDISPSITPDLSKPHSEGDIWNASTGNWQTKESNIGGVGTATT